MPEQLIIGFNPMSAANKVAYFSSQIRARLLWLVIAVLICVWIWVWQRQSLSGTTTALLFGVGIVYSAIWLAVAFINWLRARRSLSAISPGVAAAVDRQGMWLAGTGRAWPEIAQIDIAPGRFGGSPNLSVKGVDGRVSSICLADLDVMPGTIDSAVRSYSAGTHAINTAKLGN